MRVIQVAIDDTLLGEVNDLAKSRGSSRAAIIREACKEYVRGLEREALERRYAEGYRRKRESPMVGKLGERMAQEVWPGETWDGL
jgi:hypothetical protein